MMVYCVRPNSQSLAALRARVLLLMRVWDFTYELEGIDVRGYI